MANPAKKKGTGGEVELLKLLVEKRPAKNAALYRTSPGSPADLHRPSPLNPDSPLTPAPLAVLATRPDHGRWLVTMTVDDFLMFVDYEVLDIQVKRYAKFRHHTIFEGFWEAMHR